MGWRLTLYVIRNRAGRGAPLALAAVLALGLVTGREWVAVGLTSTRACVLDVRGFTTVYGDTAVHEAVWINRGGRRVATLDVIDTPGVAGLATATLPCGTYTLQAPPAPAADTAMGAPVTLLLASDEDYTLGQRQSPAGPSPRAPVPSLP